MSADEFAQWLRRKGARMVAGAGAPHRIPQDEAGASQPDTPDRAPAIARARAA